MIFKNLLALTLMLSAICLTGCNLVKVKINDTIHDFEKGWVSDNIDYNFGLPYGYKIHDGSSEYPPYIKIVATKKAVEFGAVYANDLVYILIENVHPVSKEGEAEEFDGTITVQVDGSLHHEEIIVSLVRFDDIVGGNISGSFERQTTSSG